MRNLSLTAVFVGILLLFRIGYSYAQQENLTQATPPADAVKTEYDLAYPGILPDNPLYKLKVLRDKISIMLISNPYKKIGFYLLQADKGILATAMLVDRSKFKLAEETALKAEHNMTLTTYELKTVLEKPSNELFEKLKIASKKHQEVLSALMKRLPSESKKTFINVINFSEMNLQTIEKLQNKKYYN